MENLDILKIKLKGIEDCVLGYTREPAISNVITALDDALSKNNYDIIIFCCKELVLRPSQLDM